jgi:hypothetical protein
MANVKAITVVFFKNTIPVELSRGRLTSKTPMVMGK